MSDRDIDAQFAAIVAHWDDAAPQPPKPRTVQDITSAYAALTRAEPDPATAPDPDDAATDTDAVTGSPSDPAVMGAPTAPAEQEAWRQGPSIDAEDDHFEPGPVALPPGEDIGYWGAVVGLVGGPLLLLWVALASPFHAGWWILGAIALFLGGFGLLVLRQPAHRDPYDNDDGARG